MYLSTPHTHIYTHDMAWIQLGPRVIDRSTSIKFLHPVCCYTLEWARFISTTTTWLFWLWSLVTWEFNVLNHRLGGAIVASEWFECIFSLIVYRKYTTHKNRRESTFTSAVISIDIIALLRYSNDRSIATENFSSTPTASKWLLYHVYYARVFKSFERNRVGVIDFIRTFSYFVKQKLISFKYYANVDGFKMMFLPLAHHRQDVRSMHSFFLTHVKFTVRKSNNKFLVIQSERRDAEGMCENREDRR